MSSDESDDGDDFVTFGSSLAPIEEEEIPRKKPVPIEEQVVTDDHGRRRFHGAFTGGFSAGYFNSVGSKEGWKPKEFVSSRSQKTNQYSQKPEDFMDEEDMGAFGFAPQVLRASKNFSKSQEPDDRKRKLHQDEPLLAHAIINNILQPARETIGVRLLTAMGWRPGQGIGPRLSRHDRSNRQKSHARMFGPTLPESTKNDEEVDDDNDDEFSSKYQDFLFAPDDVPNFVVTPKENKHGIGYKGLDRSSVLGSRSSGAGLFNLFDIPPNAASRASKQSVKSGRSLKISGQAFGVGAFEEDDDDIYGADDMANYDFSLSTGKDETQVRRREKSAESRWSQNDDISVIQGFEFDPNDEASAKLQNHFPAPEIPKSWQPKFLRLKSSRFEPEKSDPKNLTPMERRAIVSTEPVQTADTAAAPTQSDEQLQKLLSTNFETTSTTATASSSLAASFKPFATNAEKQTRYEKYLVCVKNNRSDALHLLQPKTMTEWERERERVEFERASVLYKPLTTSMSSRFVSAGTSQEVENVGERSNDSTKAAKLKLFGSLTREKVEWHPAKLLCIRFNVKHPYGDHSVIGVPSSYKSKFDIFGRLDDKSEGAKSKVSNPQIDHEAEDNQATMEVEEGEEEGSFDGARGPPDDENVAKTTMDPETSEESVTKPPIDLFKSIFLDDSEEEDQQVNSPSDNAVELSPDQPVTPLQNDEPVDHEKSEHVSSQARRPMFTGKGLFASVDFDRLNRKTTNNASSRKEVSDLSSKKSYEAPEVRLKNNSQFPQSAKGDAIEDVYGPAKPASAPISSIVETFESETESSAQEIWTEKKSAKSSSKAKKKKEKKKKSKKKSHKSEKHKKKKKKYKHESSSSDVSTESDD